MARQQKQNKTGFLRIIAGAWRGRQLGFSDVEGLRPTGDRIRETLFNWLQPSLGFSRCLDCFAGSGALGFEAASRGASQVVMVEADRQAFNDLKQNQGLLKADQCDIIHGRIESYLATASQPFDVVFLDPPYQLDLWSDVATLLTDKGLLNKGARIYLEYPRRQSQPLLPPTWHCLREKQAGDVKYALFEFQPGAADG
ncbi:16S rRNA (guanine(966)-N(2))-methyltransferase RsmD [Methylophaga sp.]|uniref:16S rRNA (guanine(966)-N(2))-methyltransferase RsmD n=1 Tax=Methylophaga sp. TaxID=2024840 RepID=UPI0013FE7008|nr:16S rRNA (guanine(966)-N(2))-methyltransferase RsmD [Methylophaga sp.]MTI62619.1 16S rRNA (guanine(966)-N(2))-methyltransferase RsmD [Methylophaga sp.]